MALSYQARASGSFPACFNSRALAMDADGSQMREIPSWLAVAIPPPGKTQAPYELDRWLRAEHPHPR